MVVDDEQGIIDSLVMFLNKYEVKGYTDPREAIEALKHEHFDLLILDFLMMPIHGDQVVEEIRKFNTSLYILLLTGHKDLAPPLETIKRLDIQGYCEKSDRFDQILLLVESGLKSVSQMRIIQDINQKLESANDQLKDAYYGTIETLRLAVDAKDSYTRNHSDRVSYYSVMIGKQLGLSEDELETLKQGALFHDVGKIGIPDEIINKPSKLTSEEYDIVKTHAKIGSDILQNITEIIAIASGARWHHERYDGKGYPDGLKGKEIPEVARIIGVADAYDAMTSKRSYRETFSQAKVRKEIVDGRETQFDPYFADIMIDMIDEDAEYNLREQE